MFKSKREFLERAGRCNRHHIQAKSRGGKATDQNLILLDERRHAAYHLLFKNLNFIEAAALLVRAYEMKNGRRLIIRKTQEVTHEKYGQELSTLH